MSSINLENVYLDYPVYDADFRSIKRSILGRLPVGGSINHQHGKTTIRALEDFSLQINQGDRVALVGHNGAGKSSLLRVMAGVYKPQRGTVSVDGRVTPLLQRGLGMDPTATGRENIILNGLVLGLDHGEIMEKAEEIAIFSGLGEYLDIPIRTYSEGMNLRLAFSISASIEPDILLMDEWIIAGDMKFMNDAIHRLESMIEKSAILVVATHSFEYIESLCNKVALIEHGKLIDFGDPDRVLSLYDIERASN